MTEATSSIPYIFAFSPPVEDAAHPPKERICEWCHQNLFAQAHAPGCPETADIFRLNVTGNAEQKRSEDLLQACTTRAWMAWRKNGHRP
jgi:hypothetical protein